MRIPPEVKRQLGWYVYLYVDPRDGKPFYVGKGKNGRVLSHLNSAGESRKAQIISALRKCGRLPELSILAHKLPDAQTAYRIEAAAIGCLKLENLANCVSGHDSLTHGRQSLDDLTIQYAAKPVDVAHPLLLIRINRLYRPGMLRDELYQATRGRWKVGTRRDLVRYVLAVFEGVVREAYEIERWEHAGTTPDPARPLTRKDRGRWEFVGKPAPANIRKLYVGRSVRHYLKAGMRSPTVYAGV